MQNKKIQQHQQALEHGVMFSTSKMTPQNGITRRRYLKTKSHEGDISKQNRSKEISQNEIARMRYLQTKSHEGDIPKQITARNNNNKK
jgi:hypothetical protein